MSEFKDEDKQAECDSHEWTEPKAMLAPLIVNEVPTVE